MSTKHGGYVEISPLLPGEPIVEGYQRLAANTFLAQSLIPIIDHEAPTTSTFSAHLGHEPSLVAGLLHEIAHAIQLKRAEYQTRLNTQATQIFVRPASAVKRVRGLQSYEPQSAEPTYRECETVAIQLHLAQLLGYKININKYITTWARVLDNGSLVDTFSVDRRTASALLIRGFYLSWKGRTNLMEKRFKNYCEYVYRHVISQLQP